MSALFRSNQIGNNSDCILASKSYNFNNYNKHKHLLYHNLVISNCFIQISELMYQYSKGNFEYLITNLNNISFSKLSLELYKLKKNKHPVYELIRINLVHSLEGLLQCVYQSKELQSTLLLVAKYKEGYTILHDKTLLQEYLDNLKNSFSSLPECIIKPVQAVIKPEIIEYIKLYGFPANAIFEADKLAEIIDKLNGESDSSSDSDNNDY